MDPGFRRDDGIVLSWDDSVAISHDDAKKLDSGLRRN